MVESVRTLSKLRFLTESFLESSLYGRNLTRKPDKDELDKKAKFYLYCDIESHKNFEPLKRIKMLSH